MALFQRDSHIMPLNGTGLHSIEHVQLCHPFDVPMLKSFSASSRTNVSELSCAELAWSVPFRWSITAKSI